MTHYPFLLAFLIFFESIHEELILFKCIFAKIIFVKKAFTILFILIAFISNAQTDTLQSEYHINGNIGVTNNGISIIPTFSLKAPAFNTSFSFSKGGRFSIDPDVRLTFDGTKGGAMLWFRYKLVKDNKFQFTVGAHPAYNFALRSVTENGKTWNITQARRFWATELAPNYTFNDHFALGVYYLNGHGLQDDGPKKTHFVTFSTSFLNLPIGGNYLFNLNPQVYYLQVDQQDGYYLSGSAILANKKYPFSLMYTYNKEIHTNITGSMNFDWNITLRYGFSNSFKLSSPLINTHH
jgi:hypothetical protein